MTEIPWERDHAGKIRVSFLRQLNTGVADDGAANVSGGCLMLILGTTVQSQPNEQLLRLQLALPPEDLRRVAEALWKLADAAAAPASARKQ